MISEATADCLDGPDDAKDLSLFRLSETSCRNTSLLKHTNSRSKLHHPHRKLRVAVRTETCTTPHSKVRVDISHHDGFRTTTVYLL